MTKTDLPKLPIGIQTFDEIRSEGYLYVDKTKYLVDLINMGKVYFLSRPRRFGKSLTISTLDALFSGKRELFKGLFAEKFFDAEYKTHPVIRLDMSQVTTDMDFNVLRSSLFLSVYANAERLGVNIGFPPEVSSPSPADAFDILMRKAADKYGAPVVVLVDEYDKPILDNIYDPEKAKTARDILRNFYVRIKAADRYVRFVFITGISKFSKAGVFSSLNNLVDISMHDRYAAMLGYTEEELLFYFNARLDHTAAKLRQSKEDLIAGIRGYYDGFSFDGRTRLYNPFSTLSFFNDPTFRNYWFETGTPSFLVEYVKRHDLEAESFRGLKTDDEFTAAAEIESASPESFLYQSGYLSVREKYGRELTLDYPNMEVLSSVAKLLLYGKFNFSAAGSASIDIEKAMSRGNAEEVIKIYNALLAGIPYDLYAHEERKYKAALEKKESYPRPPYAESFYHALLFALLWSSRVKTSAENHSYWGRSDIEAEANGRRYVIELKAADGEEAARRAAGDAMKQIREKGYADKYAENAGEGVTLVALAVDKEKRRVTEFVIEKLS